MDVNNHEFSWKYTRLHGQWILPPVRHQGRRPSCVFHALASGVEMEIRRVWALEVPPRSTHIRIFLNQFIRQYEFQAGAPLGRDNGVRRLPVGLRLLARQGVYAECGDWPDARRVHISGALVGPNGIYHFQRRRGDVYPPLRHMVLFVGYGRRGGRPYLIFQNSSGRRFGEDGYGRIWFQEARDFTTFTVRKGTCPTQSQPGRRGRGASSSSHPGRGDLGASSSLHPGRFGSSSSLRQVRSSYSSLTGRFDPGASSSSHPPTRR
uniref:Peptidase C1A papain C-terminal domain-containing protein n=1 Tax=Aegilops tauschii TaxID=37682 RepID=R7W9W5_AEGTA